MSSKSDNIFEVHEIFKLTQYGIPLDQSSWPRVTLSDSSNLVCVIHNEGRSSSEESMYSGSGKESHINKVQIIHTSGKVVSRSKTVAESAKVHPTKPIIALKAHTHFQVYNYESKNLLNEIDLHVHSDICFWKWVNEETIIFVSDTQILQWLVFKDNSELEEVCTRLPRLNGAEIVNCSVDELYRWYTVTGLLEHGQDSVIEGITQVYSSDYGVAQCIEAHTVALLSHKFEGNLYESPVLCAASRPLESHHGKVHTIELGPALIGNALPKSSNSDLQFCHTQGKLADAEHTNRHLCIDFPVCLQADKSHSVIFILSKYGRLYIAELESAIVLRSIQISSEITFRCSLDDVSVLTIVSRSSQVFKVTVAWLKLIQYVRNVLNKPELVARLQNSRGMENVDLLQIT